MKTELRMAAHQIHPGATVVEVWWNGQFLAEVTGADGPGVRVITKHGVNLTVAKPDGPVVVEVGIIPKGPNSALQWWILAVALWILGDVAHLYHPEHVVLMHDVYTTVGTVAFFMGVFRYREK